MGDYPGNVFNDDRLAEDRAIQSVPESAIGRFPHRLQSEFLYSRFISRNRGALNPHLALFDGFRGFDGDLVIGLIAFLNGEIIVKDRNV